MADENAPLLVVDEQQKVDSGVDATQSRSKASDGLLVGMLSCIGFLNIFTSQSTILLLPSIGQSYGIPLSRQQLVTSIFNISSGCLILFWGRLADIYGRKTVFLAGTAAYTVASALLPFSPNQIIFYLFRAFQGVSVAAAVPASIGIISSTFPAGKRRNHAFVFYNAASSLGAVMGNIVGGVIGGYLSWKWIFWIAAMMGGFTGVAAFLLIPSSQNGGAHSRSFDDKRPFVDWIGGLLITASLLTLLIPLSNADGWKDACNGIQLASSVILGTAFILWQRHLEMDPVRQPLIRPSILNSTRFSAALVVYACFLASYNTFLVYASFFFQQYLGLSVLDATWRFIPSGLSGFLIAFAIAPALSIIPGLYLLVFAIICSIISPLLFALPFPPLTSYWAYGFPAMVLTMSVEILAPVISLFVVQCLPQSDQSLGGGLLQTANNIGKAIGLAAATTVQVVVGGNKEPLPGGLSLNVEAGVPGDPDLLRGMRAAQWVNVGLSAVTLVLALVFFRGLKRL